MAPYMNMLAERLHDTTIQNSGVPPTPRMPDYRTKSGVGSCVGCGGMRVSNLRGRDSCNSITSSPRYACDSRPPRNGPSILPHSAYEEGMIISATVPERDNRQCYDPLDKQQSITSMSTVVYEKTRKFIILRVFATHVTVLPILTHEGTGLSRKVAKHNYVSIRDLDDGENAAPAESEHPIIWAEALPHLKTGSAWNKMSNSAVIHFTNAREHKFSCPAIIMGKLSAKSWAALKKLFIDGMTVSRFLEKYPEPGPHELLSPASSKPQIPAHKLTVNLGARLTMSNVSAMNNTGAIKTTKLGNAANVATPSMSAFRSNLNLARSIAGGKAAGSMIGGNCPRPIPYQ
jgi:hypothetical protein